MNRDEFTEIAALMKSLWGKWNPSDDLKAVFYEELCKYDHHDLFRAVRRYRGNTRYTEPNIEELKKHLRVVIGERKDAERKSSPDWAGQVFLITHADDDGREDSYWDFHVANQKEEVMGSWQNARLQSYKEYIEKRFGQRFPGGEFRGYILTEEEAWERIRTIQTYLMTPRQQERAAKACLAVEDGISISRAFRDHLANVADQLEA
jgi:hypothetical protein